MNEKHGGPDQMTVGEILHRLRRIHPGGPTRWSLGLPHSYRGYYDQVAVTVHAHESTVSEAIDVIERCLATFAGWTSGEYTMREDTPVWVAAAGKTGFPLTERFFELLLGH